MFSRFLHPLTPQTRKTTPQSEQRRGCTHLPPHHSSPPLKPPNPKPEPPPTPTPPPFPPSHPPNEPFPRSPSPVDPPPSPFPVPANAKYVVNTHRPFEDLAFEKNSEYVNFSLNGAKEEQWREYRSFPVKLLPKFLSEEEQQSLLADIDPRLRKRRYEAAHWDYAIAGYREVTLKPQWLSPTSEQIIERIKGEIFKEGVRCLPVHVLDIEENGFLKPHIDSVLFSGGIVSGISLLSPSVMTLQPQSLSIPHPTEKANVKTTFDNAQLKIEDAKDFIVDHTPYVELLLNPGSLYVLTRDARYGWPVESLHTSQAISQV